MSRHTTYSFQDLAGAIAHPSLGAYSFTGEGVGEVTIAMLTDKTAHDLGADGSVMVSKIAGNNGKVSIKCQQTSNVHKWLLAWYNYLLIAPTNEWAQTAATLRNSADGTSHVVTGMSPTKIADKSYQSQGQQVTWELMAAEIISVTA
jgi:structural protein KPP10_ORF10